MRRTIALILCLLVLVSALSAGSSTTTIAAHYGAVINFNDDYAMTHGPGIRIIQRASGTGSKFVLAANYSIMFPMGIYQNGVNTKVDDLLTAVSSSKSYLFQSGGIAGGGLHMKAPGMNLEANIGAGLYIGGTSTIYSNWSRQYFEFGPGIFLDFVLHLSEHLSVGIYIEDGMTLGRYATVTDKYGDDNFDGFERCMNNYPGVAIGIGRTWTK